MSKTIALDDDFFTEDEPVPTPGFKLAERNGQHFQLNRSSDKDSYVFYADSARSTWQVRLCVSSLNEAKTLKVLECAAGSSLSFNGEIIPVGGTKEISDGPIEVGF